jgi:glycerol 3-phosphatase-1
VEGWLKILGLAMPRCLVTAEDVEEGKPDPACYRLGKQRLGLDGVVKVLVVEDAPAGIRAGKAAGFEVLALATTHKTQELVDAGADWIVRDLESVRMQIGEETLGSVELSFLNAYRAQ